MVSLETHPLSLNIIPLKLSPRALFNKSGNSQTNCVPFVSTFGAGAFYTLSQSLEILIFQGF